MAPLLLQLCLLQFEVLSVIVAARTIQSGPVHKHREVGLRARHVDCIVARGHHAIGNSYGVVGKRSLTTDPRTPYTVAMDKALLATRPIGMNQADVEVPAIGDPVVRRGRIPDPKTSGPASSR